MSDTESSYRCARETNNERHIAVNDNATFAAAWGEYVDDLQAKRADRSTHSYSEDERCGRRFASTHGKSLFVPCCRKLIGRNAAIKIEARARSSAPRA